MSNFLVDHALKNVWCAPRQDIQSIIKPPRITPNNGVWNDVKILWRTHKLPVQGARFHVYAIGQLHPLLMGLFPIQDTWVSMAAVCNKQRMIVDLFVDSGVQLSRFRTWYLVTPEKDLVIAVMEQPEIPVNLQVEDFHIRVYTNAWYDIRREDADNRFIKVEGARPLTTQAILDIQHRYEETLTLPGYTYAFVNGFQVSGIDLFTVKVGDSVEYVYDASIKHVIDFKVRDLRFFTSTLDQKQKYLLHYQGLGDNTIDYQDDIDVFIMKPQLGGRYQGIYCHRNQADAVRMVTHKDYSLSVQHFLALVDYRPDWQDENELVVRLHVRHGGWQRELVFENNRIKELYKLPDDAIRDAMHGIQSTVPNWRAAVLEASPYTEIMRSKRKDVTQVMVQNAYGYNAISKLLADTPEFVHLNSNQKVIDVPWGLRNRSTGFEYDVNGLLISFHPHGSSAVYPARNAKTELIEMISGEAGDILDEYYGERTVVLNPIYSYRFYTCPMANGLPTNKWTDVTDTGAYVRVGDTVTWLTDPTRTYTLVRSDAQFLAYSYSMRATDGLLKFSLNHRAYRNGVIGNYVMQIPMGELDLWLNKRSLIEGVDYYVNFPEIVIVNKAYLDDVVNKDQVIDIRFTGFCKKDFSREQCLDYGFVKQGLLSRNNRFDIRDDKVLRMIVDGQLKHRRDLKFSEDNSGVGVQGSRNGAPYLIRDIVVPLRDNVTEDTYVMRARSQVIDKDVSDYLTQRIPEPPMVGPNPISHLYRVVSPFACKLIYDLRDGHLKDDRLTGQYSDMVVAEICAPYLPLLKFDPTQEDKKTDYDYVIIHPHNLMVFIDLDIYLYRFLARAVKIYLGDKVNLSHFITVSAK
jgi:hypothetical protein